MKKKLVMLLAGMLAVGMLNGCGSNDANTENAGKQSETVASAEAGENAAEESTTGEAEVSKINANDYVTLGDYKNLEITLAAPTVDETVLASQLQATYEGYVTAENGGITDRAVADGDTVVIDYEGKKDGVAFNGGTASGQTLGIGSGAFIDGFEEGLIGVMPGETVDLNLTFPEGYQNTELAGQDVVFTVTVHYIIPTEMEDAVVANMGIVGVTNVEELEQYVYDDLYAEAEANYQTELEYLIMEALVADCTYAELPADKIAEYEQNVRDNLDLNASYYGLDAATLVLYFYGREDFDVFVAENATVALQQELAVEVLAEQEGLTISDEELDELLLETAKSYGYSTIEELIGEDDHSSYRSYFLYNKVMEYLKENVTVKNN